MSTNSLKKGNYIVFNDEFPCSILEINKSAPGKHGHAKYNMMGRNLLTGNKHNMVLNHHDRPNFVEVKRRTLYCQYFDDNYAYAVDDEGDEETFLVKGEELVEKIESGKYDDGCNISVMDLSYTLGGDDEPRQESVVMEIK